MRYKLLLQIPVFFCLLGLVFGTTYCFGQEEHYKNYTVRDGLPSNQVYKSLEDNEGYIWFLTDKGLSKFDGYEFENFSSADGLTDNVFFDATLHKDGSIWFLGMNSSVTIYRNNKFEAFQYSASFKAKEASIPAKIILTDKHLYISYANVNQLIKFTLDGKFLVTSFQVEGSWYGIIDSLGLFYKTSSNPELVSNKLNTYVFTAAEHPYDDGFALPGNETFVYLFGKDSVLVKSKLTQKIIYCENYLKAGAIDDGFFWVSAKSRGVFIFDRKGNQVQVLKEGTSVTNVFVDQKGSKWISTLYNGVFKETIRVAVLTENRGHILDLEKGSNEELFISYRDGSIDKMTAVERKNMFQSVNGNPSSMVYNHLLKKLIFIADSKLRYLGEQLSLSNIGIGNRYGMIVLPDNKLGVCDLYGFYTWQNGKQDFLLQKRTYSVAENERKFFLGTKEGLYMVDKDGDTSSVKFSATYKGRINKVVFFKDRIFLGTHGDGLVILNKAASQVISTYQGNEIAGNYVSNIVVKNDSVVWVCTNEGLMELMFNDDMELLRSVSINQNHGLLSPEVTDVAFIRDTLWVGTPGGLYRIVDSYFRDLSVVNNYKLRFRDTYVNDKVLLEQSLENLNYRASKVEFNFSAIHFDEIKLRYRYMLKGVEENWNYTKERKAIYSSLNPGNYEFIVQVKGENQSWLSNSISLKVNISPPFWKTWWFIVGAFLLGILSIYAFFKYRILLYNKDLVRELIRQLIRRLSPKTKTIVVREGNKNVKIFTKDINYVKSDGNYLEIHHSKGKTTIRHKIGEFIDLVPDPLEFTQIRRSFIVRIDKVEQKGADYVVVNGRKIKVGSTFQQQMKTIKL